MKLKLENGEIEYRLPGLMEGVRLKAEMAQLAIENNKLPINYVCALVAPMLEPFIVNIKVGKGSKAIDNYQDFLKSEATPSLLRDLDEIVALFINSVYPAPKEGKKKA